MATADLSDDLWNEIILILNENSDITNLVGNRIYDNEFIVIAENQYPCISVQLVNEEPSLKGRATGYRNIKFRFRIRAYSRILDANQSMRQSRDIASTIVGELEKNLHLTLHQKAWRGDSISTKYGELEMGENKTITQIADIFMDYHAFIPRSTP
jgi:hypothetical protein